jgi:hypothetical protein
VPVPSGATTGNIVVTVGGLASTGVAFTVTVPPSISNLSPITGPIGTPVTITGANFGASQGSSTVAFNGTNAGTATTWTDTSIVVPVPTGAATGNVVVTVSGLASSGVPFTVTVPPSISNLSPTSGPVGTAVTITGTNFGASQGTSIVAFNGTDLVTDGYLREVPIDPIVGNNTSWRIIMEQPMLSVSQTEPGIFDVKSASDAKSLEGTSYSDW